MIKRFAGFLILASVMVISTRVTLAQISGIALAFGIWRSLPASRARIIVATILMALNVVAYRLEPFHFSDIAGHYSWTPFLSFMLGSIDIDVQAFFEKFFLYGSLIWLMVQAGAAVRVASVSVAVLLLIASGLEIFIPGRSAEITDAILALAVGEFIRAVDAGLPAPARYGIYKGAPTDT